MVQIPTSSLFTVLQLKAHSYVSAERMGASSGFDFFPYHNSNANFIATTAQYRSPHVITANLLQLVVRKIEPFFFFSIKPNLKKTMLSEMTTYLVTKL